MNLYRGKGWGKLLFISLAERLADPKMKRFVLWVVAENPACKFYEVMGGQMIKEKTASVGGVSLREIAYGWQTTNWRDV